MTYLGVLIFIFGFFGCLSNRNSRYRNYGDYENRERSMYYNIVGLDNHEGKEDIWRPCSLDDYDCMAHFLASNSQCTPALGYTPDPISLPIEKFYSPITTMTITHLNAKVRGFKKAKVTEFYMNKATGNVVIAVSIPTYNLSSNAFFTYQRTAKEPVTRNDYNTFETDNVTLTAVIPKAHDLRLEMADVHAKMPEARTRYYIGPEVYESKDLEITSKFKKFEAGAIQVVREAFILHSYYLMSVFIQKELCDFGIDSYKSYNGHLSFHRGYSRDKEY